MRAEYRTVSVASPRRLHDQHRRSMPPTAMAELVVGSRGRDGAVRRCWRPTIPLAVDARIGLSSVCLLRNLYMARSDALQGALPMLVLKLLARRGPLHGYAITTQIESFSSDVLRVEEGS